MFWPTGTSEFDRERAQLLRRFPVKAGFCEPDMTRTPRIPRTESKPRVLYLLPAIPDAAPSYLKNGLAVRNACAIDGVCPNCGAVVEVRQLAPLVYAGTFRHERWCGVLLDSEVA
jgi:hypothetical protein